MLSRREFLASSAASISVAMSAWACGSSTETNAPADPLNVLFLFPDQMRAQAMGCMGPYSRQHHARDSKQIHIPFDIYYDFRDHRGFGALRVGPLAPLHQRGRWVR